MENKVNSLILDYEIVLAYVFWKSCARHRFYTSHKSSNQVHIVLQLLLLISGLNGFTIYV